MDYLFNLFLTDSAFRLDPRPPALEPVPQRLRILWQGQTIADTTRALRILETSHPPTYYIPPEDINMELLKQVPGKSSYCEWKGRAIYYDVHLPDSTAHAHARAWSYPNPNPQYGGLKDYVGFYVDPFDCYVGEEKARPQEGQFYAGWVTSNLEGKMKGGPGTWGW